jgi:hypothetical protein
VKGEIEMAISSTKKYTNKSCRDNLIQTKVSGQGSLVLALEMKKRKKA